MEPTANAKGMHLHPCFSKEQPFIFTNARRKPTGYWFVDYSQGKSYWSSGTVPGGFCSYAGKADKETSNNKIPFSIRNCKGGSRTPLLLPLFG